MDAMVQQRIGVWLCCQPARAQTHRGGFRLDQERRWLRQTKLRGLAEVDWTLTLAAAYDLVRLQKLIGAT